MRLFTRKDKAPDPTILASERVKESAARLRKALSDHEAAVKHHEREVDGLLSSLVPEHGNGANADRPPRK